MTTPLPPSSSFPSSSLETNALMQQMYSALIELGKDNAVVKQQLMTVLRNLEQDAQHAARQDVQINQLVTDISVIKNDLTTWKNDMSLWRTTVDASLSDLPETYVPRKEHDAANHERRIAALEQGQDAASVQSAQAKGEFQQWVHEHSVQLISMGLTIVAVALSILGYLHSVGH